MFMVLGGMKVEEVGIDVTSNRGIEVEKIKVEVEGIVVEGIEVRGGGEEIGGEEIGIDVVDRDGKIRLLLKRWGFLWEKK